MNDFLEFVFSLLQDSIGIAVIAVCFCSILLLLIYFIHRKKSKGEKPFPWLKAVLTLAFVGYITIVLFVTLLRYGGYGYSSTNFHLFRAWREAWNNYSFKNWLNVLLNIAMFVPFGCLLPLLSSHFKKWYVLLLTGAGASLFIEVMQYVTGRGLFDVDDLFTNTIGAALGYYIVMALQCLFQKENKKKCFPYLIYPTVFFIIIMGIFVKYEIQEYGNLPEAPIITADTKDIAWKLECELSEINPTVPIYSIEPFDKNSCDIFGAEFAQTMNISFPDIYYYDNSTIFANHSTGDFLTINYFDRSYDYSVGDTDLMLEDTEIDEKMLKELLQPYPISIPDSAKFSFEGNGIHTLTVEMEQNGNSLVDGTITCRVKEGNLLAKINNHLVTYTLYKEEPIISETDAYTQMCQGKFYGSDELEYYNPKTILTKSCSLEYRIDTKGFYQPVYAFEILVDEENTSKIIIPAMK